MSIRVVIAEEADRFALTFTNGDPFIRNSSSGDALFAKDHGWTLEQLQPHVDVCNVYLNGGNYRIMPLPGPSFEMITRAY